MGACAISGGPFKQGYNVLKGIDRYIPVDVHIPGCPPRPEALIHAFMTLQARIDAQPLTGERAAAASGCRGAGVSFRFRTQGAHDLEPSGEPAGVAAACCRLTTWRDLWMKTADEITCGNPDGSCLRLPWNWCSQSRVPPCSIRCWLTPARWPLAVAVFLARRCRACAGLLLEC